MHDIPNRIADVLLAVEVNLRQTGLWEPVEPPARALQSREPFCLDTLRFEQWLQWIFLPRMKSIVEHSMPLPPRSAIYVFAQESLPINNPASHDLLNLIKQFDELISIQAAARPH